MEENEITEFKEALDEDAIIKTITAFSNQKGGKIYVGIKDNGEIKGVVLGKQKIEQFTRKIHDEIKPTPVFSTEIEKSSGKDILVIEVIEARRKPIFYNGIAYKRVNKTTLKVSDPEEIRNLFTNKTVFFDEIICEGATLQDIEERDVAKFVALGQSAGRISLTKENTKDALEKLGLLERGKLKNGAIMLFGKEPRKFFKIWGIKCAGISDNFEFSGLEDYDQNIFVALEKAGEFIAKNIKKEIEVVGLRRIEKPVIPLEVVREALVNAVAHRDYFFHSYIYVAIHPDYLEIKNPGKLEGLTIEELSKDHTSVVKNPHIAQALYIAGFIDRWGSGTLKMTNYMREQRLRAPEFVTNGSFYVRLYYAKQFLNQREEFAIEKIKSENKVTPKEIANKFKVSITAAVSDLKRLVGHGIIEKIGKGKGSYYTFAKPH